MAGTASFGEEGVALRSADRATTRLALQHRDRQSMSMAGFSRWANLTAFLETFS